MIPERLPGDMGRLEDSVHPRDLSKEQLRMGALNTFLLKTEDYQTSKEETKAAMNELAPVWREEFRKRGIFFGDEV